MIVNWTEAALADLVTIETYIVALSGGFFSIVRGSRKSVIFFLTLIHIGNNLSITSPIH